LQIVIDKILGGNPLYSSTNYTIAVIAEMVETESSSSGMNNVDDRCIAAMLCAVTGLC